MRCARSVGPLIDDVDAAFYGHVVDGGLDDVGEVATVGDVVLVHPAAQVETVGFHESNHDGARQMEIVRTTVVPLVLESRERLTGSHTAADIVTDPTQPIRSPVTGVLERDARLKIPHPLIASAPAMRSVGTWISSKRSATDSVAPAPALSAS